MDILQIQQATHMIHLIMRPILLFFGTVGNIMSLIVWRRIRRGQESHGGSSASTFLVMALAVADLSVLWVSLFYGWLRTITNVDYKDHSSILCKGHTFLRYTCIHVAAWIVVAFTVQRALAVCIPFRVKSICTVKNSKILLVCIIISMAGFHAQFFWTVDSLEIIRNNQTSTECGYKPYYRNFMTKTFLWVNFLVEVGCPFVVLLVSNLVIIYKLRQQRRDREIAEIAQNNTSNVHGITVTLLVVSFEFLFLNFPVVVYYLGYATWYAGADRYTISILGLASAIVRMLFYTNNSINFLLYCVSGPRFRQELLVMLNLARLDNVQPTHTDALKRQENGHDTKF